MKTTLAERIFRSDPRVWELLELSESKLLPAEAGALLAEAWARSFLREESSAPTWSPATNLASLRESAQQVAASIGGDGPCVVHPDCRLNPEVGRLCEIGRSWRFSRVALEAEALDGEPGLWPVPLTESLVPPVAGPGVSAFGRSCSTQSLIRGKLRRLIIAQEAGRNLVLWDMRVGQSSLFGSDSGPIPAVVFSERAYPVRLPEVQIDHSKLFTLRVSNVGTSPVTLRGVLLLELLETLPSNDTRFYPEG